MYKEQLQDKREIHFFFGGREQLQQRKREERQQQSEKREVFGLVFSGQSELELQERRFFFLLLDNYSSKVGFLSLAAFGRRFLVLFSVFFFISYFQFVLEDD